LPVVKETIDLPDAELELLAALNRMRNATARDLRDAIAPHRPMAHGSVLTLLARLEAKTLVEKAKGDQGKAFIYRATAKGRSVTRPLMRRLVDRIFGGDSVSLVATLFDSRTPTTEEIDEMQQLLDDLRKKSGR
jgi:BlaI family penicillinase repressor